MRRRQPQKRERVQYDAQAAGANCRLCPLSKSCQPVKPRLNPGAALTVVESWPARSEDERGEPTRHPASELLRKNLASAGLDDYGYTYAILCRPPKGTTKKDIDAAIECCQPRLRRDVEPHQDSEHERPSERRWVLSLGAESFRATTGKLASLDAWVGAPIDAQWPGVRVIPTWSPGWILKPDGSAHAPVFAGHVWRAAFLSDGRLGDFQWNEIVLDRGPAMTAALEKIIQHAESGGEYGFDLESGGLAFDSAISCMAFAIDELTACIQFPPTAEEDTLIRRLLRAGVMCGQNISAWDRQLLTTQGYEVTPTYEDSLLAASILDPQLRKNLQALVSSEFHSEAWKSSFRQDVETGLLLGEHWSSTDPTVERQRREYCAKDSFSSLKLWQKQKQRLREYV